LANFKVRSHKEII